MATVKVVMRASSYKTRAGETREVDADIAKALIANGHAVKAPPEKKAKD